MFLNKKKRRIRIKYRTRRKIFGDSIKPRLSVFRSNKEIYAQIINDVKGETLVFVSSLSFKKNVFYNNNDKNNISRKFFISSLIGEEIAKKAIFLGIKKVVFDRNGYLYHGRIKVLADHARKNGLKF